MTTVEESSVPPEGPPNERVEDALPVHGEDAPGEPEVEPIEESPPEAPLDPLQEALARADTLADKLKRAEAEFVNESKRMRRQVEQEQKWAIEKVVVDLLPVMDALHSAREGLGEEAVASGMRTGLDLVAKQLQTIFERHGVVEIQALGEPFDPSHHQAIMMVENPNFEPQQVCEVLRPGYELNGRVVRASEVMVVKAPTPEPDPAGQAGGEADDARTDVTEADAPEADTPEGR